MKLPCSGTCGNSHRHEESSCATEIVEGHFEKLRVQDLHILLQALDPHVSTLLLSIKLTIVGSSEGNATMAAFRSSFLENFGICSLKAPKKKVFGWSDQGGCKPHLDFPHERKQGRMGSIEVPFQWLRFFRTCKNKHVHPHMSQKFRARTLFCFGITIDFSSLCVRRLRVFQLAGGKNLDKKHHRCLGRPSIWTCCLRNELGSLHELEDRGRWKVHGCVRFCRPAS